jgi:HAD superfamily phosphatase
VRPNPAFEMRMKKRAKDSWPAETRVLIFDVDGVLLDVRHSYHRTVLETVRHFTGRRVTYAQLHEWKNRSGFNDDWKLSTDWIQSLGHAVPYDKVKEQFNRFFWGLDDKNNGHVHQERWMVSPRDVKRWSERYELAVFTGRNRQEFGHTFEAWPGHKYISRIVTAEDVEHGKPNPEGLLLILDGREPKTALYVGDNIDDARAARAAGVPFLGVLPTGSLARRKRAAGLREMGAVGIVHRVRELDRWLKKNVRRRSAR